MADGDPQSAEDRTEAPTARRLEQAQEDGQAALSREAIGFATLLAATLAGFLALPPLGRAWLRVMRTLLETAGAGEGMPAVPLLLRHTALALLPLLALVALTGALASLAQTGLVLRVQALAPQLSRISPAAALKRFSGRTGWRSWSAPC